ncbi:hypothetical protein Gotri_015978, partial [Gossypium trilobum]|nr:hypothetical protein [Gossypium trilobum]
VIHKILGSPRLSALNEDKKHLATKIDRCQNDLSYYQTQVGIDLIAKAKYLFQERDYQLRTDGRRIMAYHSHIIEENNEESIGISSMNIQQNTKCS